MDELILLQKENEWLIKQNKALGDHVEKLQHSNSLLRARNKFIIDENEKLKGELKEKNFVDKYGSILLTSFFKSME